MDISTLLTAIQAPHEDASHSRARGILQRANEIDETLARVLLPLAMALEDDGGRARALRSLMRLETPLPIDALVSPMWSQASVRVEAALFLPTLGEILRLADVEMTITDAIRIGAPIYNDGDSRGCATCYWAAAFCLVLAPAPRGIPGLTRALKPLRAVVEENIPSVGDDPRAIDDFAWHMRHALDATLTAIR